jgi:hypothetical protein
MPLIDEIIQTGTEEKNARRHDDESVWIGGRRRNGIKDENRNTEGL